MNCRIILFSIICSIVYGEDIPFKPFSSLWYNHEGGVPPFIISSQGLHFFRAGASSELREQFSSDPLWPRYSDRYTRLHEWYYKVPLYSKETIVQAEQASYAHAFSLYDLAPSKGRGIRVGCIDTGVGVIAKNVYDIHPALKDCVLDIPITYNNCIEDIVHALFYHVTVPSSIWCVRFRFLEDRVYQMVVEYLRTHSLESFLIFLKRYGNADLFTSSHKSDFSYKGYELIQRIQNRVETVVPIVYNNVKVPLDTLNYTCNTRHYTWAVNHGNGVAGIIAGKSHEYEGVAPEATIVMAKVFTQDAKCTAATFVEGLLMMIKHKVAVVCMSLQIPQDALSGDMHSIVKGLVQVISYSISPSGNDAQAKEYVSFPATDTTFSIGSFMRDPIRKTFPIMSCSQYKKDEGPLFVMPGSVFVMPCSTVSLTQQIEHHYAVLHGTSFAAAFTAGLLALFLGEVDSSDFTRREILTILYSSGCFLEKTDDWKIKSILGTLDISTALFIVLVLRAVKYESSLMRDLCKLYFEQSVGIMHLLLKQTEYGKRYTQQDSIIFFKTIICSLITHVPIDTSIISEELKRACYLLLAASSQDVFSPHVRYAVEKHAGKPDPLDYNLITRIYGAYEAERIKEYVESYILYYWQ